MFKPVDPNLNFVEMEKKWLKHWFGKGIVNKYLHKNDASERRFSFQDGPITANNPMGIHHAWGRTYKDLWQRFFNLLGYRQRFQNGFDCQGLWVEVEVEKELGLKSKKDIENLVSGDSKASIAKFVQLCKDRVNKFAVIQTEQTKRLGNFMDWENSYFTMSDENNYMIWRFLKKCFENGWIYKGRDSVPWCPRCETAISQHEMLTEDYKETVHESIYFKLPIVGRQNEYLLVWTTTPWTLPANIAVAVDEKMDYVLVEGENGESYWMAKGAVERVLGRKQGRILKSEKGKTLVGMVYNGPYDDIPAVEKVKAESGKKFHTVIATDEMILPITADEGTGLVHTAVSAGVEDFKLGKKYGLPIIEVIGDNADYLSTMGELAGKNAKKHPELIIDFLKTHENGRFLLKTERYKHRYPACWRCKTELVWKVADEWYIAMDQKMESGKTFREMMIAVAKKIKWMPEFGLERELDWLKNMHDWLISKKNRYWGLALPIYECKKCGRFEVLGSREELKERAILGWDEFKGKSPHKPYIDAVKIKCNQCDEVVSRIDDVGNPWLDAGIVPYSTITEKNKGEPLYKTNKSQWQKWFPADFITESFPGQFKNWFYALIAMSAALEQKAPFKTVLGFGTLLGEDGRPMHKSWGNSIEFNEGADRIGVDVMRWMFARQDPADNMLFGYKKADDVRRQFYLMLYNVYRYFVEYANLDKYHPPVIPAEAGISTFILPTKSGMINVLDLWIVNRLHWLIKLAEESLKNYDAKDVALEAERFVSDLSTWYIRRSRERVWVNSDDKADKQSFYDTLYHILVNLSVILSPILPFITEEIYTALTGEESVHLTSWPKRLVDIDNKLISDMELVREIAEVGHRVRKENKIKVRQKLNKVLIKMPQNKKFNKADYKKQYLSLIKDELNVVNVELTFHDKEIAVKYDTVLTDELKKEGEARELVRMIQQERKKMGFHPSEPAIVTVVNFPEEYEDFIKRKVIARQLKKGAVLRVVRI